MLLVPYVLVCVVLAWSGYPAAAALLLAIVAAAILLTSGDEAS